MQVVPFPKYAIRAIESLCRSYLWSGEIGKRRSLVAWKSVCRPLLTGGLGFKELLSWNRTLLFRFVYDLLVGRRSLWTLWARRNLIRSSDIWAATATASSSCVWKATPYQDIAPCPGK